MSSKGVTEAKIMDPISEYEKIRLKNIEDNKAILGPIMQELANMVPHSVAGSARRVCTQKRSYSRRSATSTPTRRNPARLCRHSTTPEIHSKRRKRLSYTENASSSSKTNHLLIKFGSFNKSRKTTGHHDENSTGLSIESSSDDGSVHVYDSDSSLEDMSDDDTEPKEKAPRTGARRSCSRYLELYNAETVVTEDDLKRVAMFVSEKQYDSEYGSSCHQCRQKTLDMKTICRSSKCVGVRGQFCGPCLRNRYGEDIKEALMDRDWHCPPCRGICNCSFCRKHAGKSCTGILIHHARASGFDDCNSYLQSDSKAAAAAAAPRSTTTTSPTANNLINLNLDIKIELCRQSRQGCLKKSVQ